MRTIAKTALALCFVGAMAIGTTACGIEPKFSLNFGQFSARLWKLFQRL
jgi:hypothetical protein